MASSIDGNEFDLKKAQNHESWVAEKGSDEIMLLDENLQKIVSVKVTTLIQVWLEKETRDFEDANGVENEL